MYVFICLLQYTCLNTQYKCPGNGTVSDHCIPINKQCDGHPDCIAGEDEENCPPKTCPPNQVITYQHKLWSPGVFGGKPAYVFRVKVSPAGMCRVFYGIHEESTLESARVERGDGAFCRQN
jgi:hypothetical protein